MIPCYASDGRSLGFRNLDAAERLVAGGFVKPSYGRKKELKAIWLCQAEEGNPIETHVRLGTPYSCLQNLDSGHRCWRLRRLDLRDDDDTEGFASRLGLGRTHLIRRQTSTSESASEFSYAHLQIL